MKEFLKHKKHIGLFGVTLIVFVIIVVSLLSTFKIRESIKTIMQIKGAEELASEAIDAQKTGDKTKAIELYEKVLEKDKSNSKARNELSILYYENKDYDKSIESWKSAVEANSEDRVALNFLGNSYRESGNTDEAVKYYKLAIEQGNTESLGNLVTLYNLEGKYDDSINILNTAIDKYPEDNSLKQLLASTYYKKGDLDKANQILVEAEKS